jgi:hypothetical protein
MAPSVRPTKTVIASALVTAAVLAVILALVLRFGGDDPSSPTSVLPAETVAGPSASAVDDQADAPAAAPATAAAPDDAITATTVDAATTAAPTMAPAADPTASIAAIATFDPDGDGQENDDDVELALADGDPATAWSTVCYASEFLGGKRGIGLVVTFDAPTTQALSVDVLSGPYQLQFFATDAETPPADFDGWGAELGTKAFGPEPDTVVSEVPAAPVRHMLVVLNELGPDDACTGENPYRGRLGEITTVG